MPPGVTDAMRRRDIAQQQLAQHHAEANGVVAKAQPLGVLSCPIAPSSSIMGLPAARNGQPDAPAIAS